MSRKDKCCGGCRKFGYEDVYGFGYCMKGEGFHEFRFCDQSVCEDFEEDEV